MGVLSALPLVNMGNACCCLWVIAGGMVAAYLLQQNQPTPITPGDGALVGLLAGLIGALVHLVVSVPLTLILGPMEMRLTQRILEMSGNIPPDMREAIERMRDVGRSGAWVLIAIVSTMFWMCIGAVFSTIGGLIGAAIFKKSGPPPGTIDVTPSPPTMP
jgi:hypothetical protein